MIDPRRGAVLRRHQGFFTVKEVAVEAGVPRQTFVRLIDEKRIPAPAAMLVRRKYYTQHQKDEIVRVLQALKGNDNDHANPRTSPPSIPAIRS